MPHVRPPDGRAAPLRGGRMRFASSRLAVGIFALTLAVAGCGGSTVTVQEVPGDPAQLTVPGNGTALAPAATATPTAEATATADPNAPAAAATPAAGAAAPAADDGSAGNGRRRHHRARRHGFGDDGPAAPGRLQRRRVRELLRREPRRLLITGTRYLPSSTRANGRSIRSSLVLGRQKSCASHPKPEPTTSVCSTASLARPLSRPPRPRSAVRSKLR